MSAVVVAVPPYWRRKFFNENSFTEFGEVRFIAQSDPLPSDTRVLITAWDGPAFTEERLAGAVNLELIAHTGATIKPYATDALWRKGIRVTQAGEAMAYAVGEVALGFTLALLHQFPRFDGGLRAGNAWDAVKDAPERHELAGSRIGVIGASRTGRHHVRLLNAIGAEVTIADPYLAEADAHELGAKVGGLRDVLATSRIVALHAPVLPETKHLVGQDELARMPDGAGLINTARSWLVDEQALLAELRTGRIDAALDVYDEEPLPTTHPFRTLSNVLLTPHEAAGPVQARQRQGQIVIDEICRHFAGEPLRHEVTAGDLARIG